MKMILGLGGNIGDMPAHLDAAIRALSHLPHTTVLRESGRYRTAPVGYVDQADFLNSVVEIDTDLSPRAVLGACLGIEACVGRVRTFRNAPRVLDVDLLMADGVQSDDEELTLPHPRMCERAFVLVPLCDLYPDGIVYGHDLRDAIAAVGHDGVTLAETEE